MTEETRIILKNELIKSADEAFLLREDKLSYILGGRKIILLLIKNDILEPKTGMNLVNELDLKNVKL